MATRGELLTELKEWLYQQANLPPDGSVTQAAVQKEQHRICSRLAVALEAPVDDITEPDLSVTVRWPAGKGVMQAAVFARDDAPEPETLTRLDRAIMLTLLDHAREIVAGGL